MKLGRFFTVFLTVLYPLCLMAKEIPTLTITEKTNPKIAELYQQIQDTEEKIQQIQSERMDKLSENYKALKENEQSIENRTLTAVTTAATGIGGMELAMGLSQQKADKDAEADMKSYISTFRCSYTDGKSFKGGPDAIELPGGNDEKIMKYRNEYMTLAEDLKERKTALGMKPGIESEEILDKIEMGLYDDENVGITSGNYASLYRANALNNEEDQSKIETDKSAAAKRVKGGAIAAGAGVVGGIVGNAIINKDAPKEESEKINSEYDRQLAETTAEQNNLVDQLEKEIAENATKVKNYNEKLQQNKDYIKTIQQAPAGCQIAFNDYVNNISDLQPIENEIDSVPDTPLPDIKEQDLILMKCKNCVNTNHNFDTQTSSCSCPEDKPIEKDGKCVENTDGTETLEEQETQSPTVTEPEKEETTNTDPKKETPEETVEEEPGTEYCPASGNRLKSINDKTKIGDSCSSTNIAVGEVIWYDKAKTKCTCVASVCNDGYHSEKGGCSKDEVKKPNCPRQEYSDVPNIKTGNDALKFCESKGGTQCKTVNAIKDYTGIKGKVLCNADKDEFGSAKQREADRKLKYYNCGLGGNEIPTDITCTFVQDFRVALVTPNEAEGLMKEWVRKRYNDEIRCDGVSHRKGKMQTQISHNNYNYTPGAGGGFAMAGQGINNMVMSNVEEHYRQCFSTKNSKQFYEFEFKDLDRGNRGFTDALCLIWGLKGGKNLCKKSDQQICDEISEAMARTFYVGGSATLKGTDCVLNTNPKAESASFAFANKLNNKHLTKEDLRTIANIDPLHFYDKKLKINANSDLYKNIMTYLSQAGLPAKQFRCGAGFVDNVPYYNILKQEYDAAQKKVGECMDLANPISETYGADIKRCQKYAPTSKDGDLLTCEYDGQPIDFLFKKLDEKWNRKSTAGYQGLRCLSEGGDFTGKSCTLANEQQCKDFNAKFKIDYPNSQGMVWDPDMETCVLKDAKMVANVTKVAEVTGMVTLTLVTSVAGGPVVWALAVVEGAAITTEAITENKISYWAENFLVDASKCKDNSNCANAVMKKHIARIIEGSNQFDETQNKQIARQIERLIGMLDEDTLTQIVDKGEASGYIGEERDPDLEKSIRAYYGTNLSSSEKALLTTKKVATVATFATLIGGGIMAGLRQSFKKGWLHIDKVKQARWVDLKILRESDVTADVFAMSKTGKKAGAIAPAVTNATKEMTASQAKKLETLDKQIAELEAKTNKTHEEAEKLKKLHQERNTLLNKVGTKDADEIAKLSSAAVDKKAVETATAEYETAKKRYDYVKKYMSEHNGNLPDGMSKQGLKEVNENMAKAENKLKELGQEVSVSEPLQIGQKPTVAPSESKHIDSGTKPQPDAPVKKPASTTPRSKVRQKLSDEVNTAIDDIKAGKRSDIVVESSDLSSEEWKALKEELSKDGLELREQGTRHYLIEKAPASPVKSATGSVDVARTTGKADDAAKGTAKTTNVSYKEGKQLVKAGKWADATVLDPTFDIKVTPLELGGKKYYLKAGNTETLIQNEISRTKQAHELLKHNKIVTSVGVVEDDQTVLKAFMDAHPDITLPRTPDTQYFIMEATHANTVEGLSDAKILGYLRNKPITIEEQNIILSEIQNMNNNGLIHNDIWHNFAIYRDSGGKLHMELMDFGDFTAEDKLLRSNDDVLEIKKLFSKWSDRGLVEKGVAKKADNISVATSSVSATKADDIVRTSNKSDGIAATAKTVDNTAKNNQFLGRLRNWKIQKIEKVSEKYRNTVFKIIEGNSGKTYYLKHVSDADEIERTKRAYDILNGQSDMIHSVKVVEDDQQVLIDFAKKNDLLETSGTDWLLIEEVPSSKTALNMLEERRNSLQTVLRGKPITLEEQQEIRKAIDRLNSGGIVHGDLEHNMFFMREPNGKLRIDIIDYEYIPGFNFADFDKNWFDRTLNVLKKYGLADTTNAVKTPTVSTIKTTPQIINPMKPTISTPSISKSAKQVENIPLKPTVEKPVITEENVVNTILHNHEVATEEYNYVRKVYNGPDGEEWVNLWERNAPRNQSLEDFQKIYGNDINKAKERLAKFDDGSEFEAMVKDAQDRKIKKQSEYSSTFDDFTSKYGYRKYPEYRNIREANIKAERLSPETQGLEKWTQTEIDEAERLYKADRASADANEALSAAEEMAEGNTLYSTYDSRVARINKKYESEAQKFNEKTSMAKQEYINKYGTNEGFEETSKYKELKKEYQEVAEQYQYEIGQISLSNQEIIAQQMKYNLDVLLSKYVDLSKRVDSWNVLTQEEKINLLQDIIDTYAKSYNTPQVKVLTEYKPNATYLAYYTSGTHNITFNTSAPLLNGNSKEVLGVFLHEYNHAIDNLTPNKGAVGAQIMKNKLFHTNEGLTYFLNPTEQNSFAVSGAVKRGLDIPLEYAESYKYNQAQTVQNSVKAAASAQ